MCGIYKVTNSINGKVYIGQSLNIEKRWRRHHTESHNPNSASYNCHFYRGIRKYGIDNFVFEVLEECEPSELDDREIYYISYFNSYEKGYNENYGGKNTFGGHKLSTQQVLEIKEKLSSQQYTLKSLSEEYQVHKDTIRDINNGWSWLTIGNYEKYPLYISYKSPYFQERGLKKQNYCVNCGTEISQNATYCQKCYLETIPTKSKEITRDELKRLIRELPFTAIGEMFNVTDNAVRKWCDKYNLPRKKKDIKNYSDEDWEKI